MVGRGVRFLLASAMMSSLGLPAMAQVDPQEQAQGRDPSPRVVRFDIPPQDLDTAMTRLADQAGIRLLGASSDLAGTRAAGLSGDYSIAQALNALLAGSGVGPLQGAVDRGHAGLQQLGSRLALQRGQHGRP